MRVGIKYSLFKRLKHILGAFIAFHYSLFNISTVQTKLQTFRFTHQVRKTLERKSLINTFFLFLFVNLLYFDEYACKKKKRICMHLCDMNKYTINSVIVFRLVDAWTVVHDPTMDYLFERDCTSMVWIWVWFLVCS